MSPALLLTLLLASLLAMMPVRRLYQAGWTSGALLTAWLVYVVGVVMGLEFGVGSRYLLPFLVVLFVLPYVAGQSRLEKLGRLLGAHPVAARPVINVTPPTGGAVAGPDRAPAKRRGRKPPVEYR